MNVDQNLLFKDILNVRSEHELLSFMESEEPYKFQALPKAFIKNHLNHWASTSNFYRFEHREQEYSQRSGQYIPAHVEGHINQELL